MTSARDRMRMLAGGLRGQTARPSPSQHKCTLCGWPVQPDAGIDVGSGPAHFVCRTRARGEALRAVETDLVAMRLIRSLSCVPYVRRAVELALLDDANLPTSSELIDLIEHSVVSAPDLDETRRRLAESLVRAWRARISGDGVPR